MNIRFPSGRRRNFSETAGRLAGASIEFCRQLWLKMDRDDILFLASGLAFNVLLCLLPILLLLIYVMGLWFQSSETIEFVDGILAMAFPHQPEALAIRKSISSILAEIVADRTAFGFLSIVVLIGTSASLFAALRAVLHRTFDVKASRNFVVSYLVDFSLVLGATLLILLLTALSWIYRTAQRFPDFLPALNQLDIYGMMAAISGLMSAPLILLLCHLLYRYVPEQPMPRRVAFISAATTTIIWEVSGRVFAWYLSTLKPFSKLYGTYAFILVLMIWTFYSSVIFVLGAEVGQIFRERFKVRGRD